MATLRANGECLVELVAHHGERRIIRRAMSSGYVLSRFGNGGWRRLGRIRAALLTDHAALFGVFQSMCDRFIAAGWDAEITA